ncbi:MAG: hypothetical protein CUN55_13425, partial [Phototrophicales bacterium]
SKHVPIGTVIVKVACYTHSDAFEILQPQWNTLLEKSNLNIIFLTWEWQSIWWSAYRPGELYLLTVYDENEQLVGIAPWFIETTSDKQRTLRTIGCADVTDYLGLIIQSELEEEVLNALVDYLSEQNELINIVDLCNIPERATFLPKLASLLQEYDYKVTVQQQEVCPVIELPTTFTDYVQSLGKKERHELKRKMRKAEGLNDSIQWYIVNDEHDLNLEITQFLELMRAASPDKEVFLSNKKNLAFFNAIIPQLYKQGWVQLAFLKINEIPTAAYLNFIYQNEVLVYNSGLNPNIVESGSPGIILLAYLIRHAIEQGYKRFDFLRGNESYKYDMGGKDTRVMNLIAYPNATESITN